MFTYFCLFFCSCINVVALHNFLDAKDTITVVNDLNMHFVCSRQAVIGRRRRQHERF